MLVFILEGAHDPEENKYGKSIHEKKYNYKKLKNEKEENFWKRRKGLCVQPGFGLLRRRKSVS